MLELEAVRSLFMDNVPFARVLGVQVTAVAPERVEVTLPESPDRLNHVGTVHAAAQFGLGETASGVMVISAFSDLQGQGAVPLAANATITYRKAARGELHAVAILSADEQARVRNDLATGNKARFTVPVQLLDRDENVTSEMNVEWALLGPR